MIRCIMWKHSTEQGCKSSTFRQTKHKYCWKTKSLQVKSFKSWYHELGFFKEYMLDSVSDSVLCDNSLKKSKCWLSFIFWLFPLIFFTMLLRYTLAVVNLFLQWAKQNCSSFFKNYLTHRMISKWGSKIRFNFYSFNF